jgi:hypothetical protein
MSNAENKWILAAVIASMVGAVFAQQAPHGIAPPTRIPNPETLSPATGGEPVSIAAVPLAVRRAVVADAARRFNVAESAVVISGAQRLTWSDGSLGCPEPGGTYTQMTVPGFLVTASTGSAQLLYHTDSRGLVVSCAGRDQFPRARANDRRIQGSEPRTQPPQSQQPDR